MTGGQAVKLDLRNSSGNKKRILVGLSWDDTPRRPLERSRYRFFDIFFGIYNFFVTEIRNSRTKKEDKQERDSNFKHRDLDLLCFIYDAEGNFIRDIGPDPEKLIDESGSVYHSGEEFTGEAVYDDEAIRIDVGKLPAHYEHFVFMVVSDSKLSLAECGTFKIRLADSLKENDFLGMDVMAPPGSLFSAYIFGSLRKNGGDWTMQPIAEFGDFDADWATELKKFI